jgi:predicted DNA-binding transcriptional regulator AlpA
MSIMPSYAPKVVSRIFPRGVCRSEAAQYIGVSPALFDEMVRDGRMPHPIRINSRTVWDVRDLDAKFEELKYRDGTVDNDWNVAV